MLPLKTSVTAHLDLLESYLLPGYYCELDHSLAFGVESDDFVKNNDRLPLYCPWLATDSCTAHVKTETE